VISVVQAYVEVVESKTSLDSPARVTFDSSGLEAGTVIINLFQTQGVTVSRAFGFNPDACVARAGGHRPRIPKA
jgi:hypothetical protein